MTKLKWLGQTEMQFYLTEQPLNNLFEQKTI